MQTAQSLVLAQQVADLHSAAGRHQLAGRGNADRPHQRGVLDLQPGGQIDQSVVDGVGWSWN